MGVPYTDPKGELSPPTALADCWLRCARSNRAWSNVGVDEPYLGVVPGEKRGLTSADRLIEDLPVS